MSKNTFPGALIGFFGLPVLCLGLFDVLASMRMSEHAFGRDVSTESLLTVLYFSAFIVAPVLGGLWGAMIGGMIETSKPMAHKEVNLLRLFLERNENFQENSVSTSPRSDTPSPSS